MFVAGLSGLVGAGLHELGERQLDRQAAEMPDCAHSSGAPSNLTIHTFPMAVVHVDGQDTDLVTPLEGGESLRLIPGSHVLEFFTTQGDSYSYSVRIVEGDNTLVIPELGGAPLEGDAISLRRTIRM